MESRIVVARKVMIAKSITLQNLGAKGTDRDLDLIRGRIAMK